MQLPAESKCILSANLISLFILTNKSFISAEAKKSRLSIPTNTRRKSSPSSREIPGSSLFVCGLTTHVYLAFFISPVAANNRARLQRLRLQNEQLIVIARKLEESLIILNAVITASRFK